MFSRDKNKGIFPGESRGRGYGIVQSEQLAQHPLAFVLRGGFANQSGIHDEEISFAVELKKLNGLLDHLRQRGLGTGGLNLIDKREVSRGKNSQQLWGSPRRGVDQLRGIEGTRVRDRYAALAKEYGVAWTGRRYDPNTWSESNDINRAISSSNAALYALTEAAVLVAGYSPAVGFLHTGKPLSFVYDIADIYKFDVSVPVAFAVVRDNVTPVENEVRRRLRTQFASSRLMERIIPEIEEILQAGGGDVDPAAGFG